MKLLGPYRRHFSLRGAQDGMSASDHKCAFRSAIAMGRFGSPEEIAGPAIFLASEAASYVTAQMLHVDGGVEGILSLPVVVET